MENETSATVADVTREARAEWSALKPEELTIGASAETETPEPSPEVAQPEATPEPEAAGEEKTETPPAPETPETQQQAEAAPEQDEEKIWNQYKDEQARKKALFENKRYAAEMSKKAREAQARAAELQAENEAFKKAQAATPPPAPTAQPSATVQPAAKPRGLQETVELLIAQEPDVRRDVEYLAQVRAKREQVLESGKKIETQVAEIGNQVSRLDAVIEHYEGLVKANPESDELKAELRQQRNTRNDLLSQRSFLAAQYADLRYEYQTAQQQHDEIAKGIVVRAQEYEAGQTRKAQEQVEFEREVKETERRWDEDFKRFRAMHGITDDEEAADINQLLARTAATLADDIGDDYLGWMNSPAARSAIDIVERARKRAIGSYAEAKRRDATQTHGNPSGPQKATATGNDQTPETPAKETTQDLSRASAKRLIAELSRG